MGLAGLVSQELLSARGFLASRLTAETRHTSFWREGVEVTADQGFGRTAVVASYEVRPAGLQLGGNAQAEKECTHFEIVYVRVSHPLGAMGRKGRARAIYIQGDSMVAKSGGVDVNLHGRWPWNRVRRSAEWRRTAAHRGRTPRSSSLGRACPWSPGNTGGWRLAVAGPGRIFQTLEIEKIQATPAD